MVPLTSGCPRSPSKGGVGRRGLEVGMVERPLDKGLLGRLSND